MIVATAMTLCLRVSMVMMIMLMFIVPMIVRVLVPFAHLRRGSPVASLEWFSVPAGALTINPK